MTVNRRFQYKMVGDTFTLDEYNAMYYLLGRNTWESVVDMDGEMSAEVSDVKISIVSQNVQFTNGHFQYNNNSKKPIIFQVTSDLTNRVTLELYYSKTVIEYGVIAGATVPFYWNPSDEFDDYDSAILNHEGHCSVESVEVEGEYDVNLKKCVCTWTPPDVDEIILFDHVKVKYTTSSLEINREDGYANQPDEILCDTFSEMYNVITNSPPACNIKIRLKGDSEYKFTKQIVIDKDKKVTIIGGNQYTRSYAYLRAYHGCRFFKVEPGATLNMKMCTMSKGNAFVYDDNIGGGILVGSDFSYVDGRLSTTIGTLNLRYCVFYKCQAVRGGGVYNDCGMVTLFNCTFRQCKAGRISDTNYDDSDTTKYVGGAIYNNELPDIYDATLEELIIKDVDLTRKENLYTLKVEFDYTQYTKLLSTITLDKTNLSLVNYDDYTEDIELADITSTNNYNYTITFSKLDIETPHIYYLLYNNTEHTNRKRYASQKFIISNIYTEDDDGTKTYQITIPEVE